MGVEPVTGARVPAPGADPQHHAPRRHRLGIQQSKWGTLMTPATSDVLARLEKIESLLASLVEQRVAKEWYSTAEAAAILRRAEFTVREWCRLGRVRAEKKKSGRGPASEWMISHAELTRVRNEGLLPDPRL